MRENLFRLLSSFVFIGAAGAAKKHIQEHKLL
jgi:hypothetical protein